MATVKISKLKISKTQNIQNSKYPKLKISKIQNIQNPKTPKPQNPMSEANLNLSNLKVE